MMWWRLFSLSALRFASLLALFLPLAHSPGGAQVVINEVYYDHPGRDDGWEFVEIYSAGEAPCDISGWRLESLDGASGRRGTVWTALPGTVIEPKGFICVAGANRNPAPEFLLKGALGNGPDAVRLVSPSGVADLLGYGDITLPDLYESTPALDVDPGFSLARKPDGNDTNRNDADFVASSPTPGRRNFFLRDVGITIGGQSILPCRGSPFLVTVTFVNCGLERYRGRVSLLSSAGADGGETFSEQSRLDLDLSPLAIDSVTVNLVSPVTARFDVRAMILDGPDDNPSNDSASVLFGSSPGEVVANEIMYRPRAGMSEWVELKNNSTRDCNLKSWTICDATDVRRLVSDENLFIPAGGFLILAKDSASFEKEYPGCTATVRRPAGGWPSLNDTDRGAFADIVELFDSDGALVEKVGYSNLLGSERGRSIERLSGSACSSLAGGVWHRCVAPAGSTPARENSMDVEQTPRDREIVISPNPFCPERDHETSITGVLAEGETGFLVRIFNLEGIEIRRIVGEKGGARVFSSRWDGRAGGGPLVRTGLYVCLVEYVGTGGGVCRKEKKCIAVARD